MVVVVIMEGLRAKGRISSQKGIYIHVCSFCMKSYNYNHSLIHVHAVTLQPIMNKAKNQSHAP